MPSTTNGDRARLVANTEIAAALTELEARCRLTANNDWQPQALFSGPSGTGKTLAAAILAARLGRDLVRVDLSAVLSKYLGETEKKLQRVFENAACTDVLLLFDEADALFGNRTEVGAAHDPFANMVVNFLLQAIENWHGLTVLTSNTPQNIDPAWLRRMYVIINFPLPDAAERERIWRLHLLDVHVLDDAWLGEIAARCAFTGAQIRNVVLAALMFAADADHGAVSRAALEAAIRREYRQRGKPCPFD